MKLRLLRSLLSIYWFAPGQDYSRKAINELCFVKINNQAQCDTTRSFIVLE
jgi:hypothetical protein